MPRRILLIPAILVAVALVVGGCSSDDDDGRRDATSTTAERASDQTSTTPAAGSAEASFGESLITEAIAGVEDFYPPTKGTVPAASYRTMADATCAALRSGKAAGSSAADVADAVAAKIPAGPKQVRQYRSGMLLFAQFLLTKSDCGLGDQPYATSVREALQPLASDALRDGVG